MRLKLLILRWIDDCGDGDDGNNPPVPSRLQVFEGFVWGMDEEGNSGTKKNLLEKGKEERERERRAHAINSPDEKSDVSMPRKKRARNFSPF